jgi:hypothetical protein
VNVDYGEPRQSRLELRAFRLYWLQILLSTLFCASVDNAFAQSIDPYARINDPRAIARLDGSDAQPLRYAAGRGYASNIWDTDGHVVMAQDSGSGIITHIWAALGDRDSVTDLKFYLDGNLIYQGRFGAFFGEAHGTLRAPLDSAGSGGAIIDVQIPYKKGFRLTFQCPSDNFYYAIAWRPVTDASLLHSFRLDPYPEDLKLQTLAESRYKLIGSLWPSGADSIGFADTLWGVTSTHKPDTTWLADVSGPGLIQTLHILPATYASTVLDSVMLEMFWDDCPYPAVRAPLNDFFSSATGPWRNRSFPIRVSEAEGFTCYFPMPFAKHAKIRLINYGSSAVMLQGFVQYSHEPIDRGKYGYFFAKFSESNPTRTHIYHPVLHEFGRGRFIGVSLAVPESPSPVILEGDPMITVDSAARSFIHYTGTEDYLDGAWWFFGAPFTLPMAGFTHIFDCFYRFHYLDAIDFNSTLDFNLQHGERNDVHDDYRTVAYYYKLWTQFWCDRDSLRVGEHWLLGGGGYAPFIPITITLGAFTLGTAHTNADGLFDTTVAIPVQIPTGKQFVHVNGITKPEPVYVLDGPTCRLVTDSLPVTVRYRDTLLVTGAGFYPGEQISLYLDSIPVSSGQLITVGADYRFIATMHIPYLPDWKYHVVARGSVSGYAMIAEPIMLVRMCNYEFENMASTMLISGGTAYPENFSFYWFSVWSEQSAMWFKPTGVGQSVGFTFYVPHADTFKVDLFASLASTMGKYTISLDGRTVAFFDGFRTPNRYEPVASDTIHAGIFPLSLDSHYVEFRCIGKQDSATSMWLAADHIVLTPTTHLPRAPGTFAEKNRVETTALASGSRIFSFPNPVTSGEVTIGVELSQEDRSIFTGVVNWSLRDILGREIRRGVLRGNPNEQVQTNIPTISLDAGDYFLSMQVMTQVGLRVFNRSIAITE